MTRRGCFLWKATPSCRYGISIRPVPGHYRPENCSRRCLPGDDGDCGGGISFVEHRFRPKTTVWQVLPWNRAPALRRTFSYGCDDSRPSPGGLHGKSDPMRLLPPSANGCVHLCGKSGGQARVCHSRELHPAPRAAVSWEFRVREISRYGRNALGHRPRQT